MIHTTETRLYAAAIFFGAFLLFLVQPLLGRHLLPWFGGGAAVWTTCMLFFQMGLLVGYLYAHLLVSNFSPRRQAIIHGMLLAGSLTLLPVAPDLSWKPVDSAMPVVRILTMLAGSVGLPYVLLAATSPLLQHWLVRPNRPLANYRLYALSNVGSLLALLLYPFAIEPLTGLRMQSVLWSGAYIAFAALVGWCGVKLYRNAPPAPAYQQPRMQSRRASRLEWTMWISLSACGSVMLLACTERISQDAAPVPFLWILPLALYLLSFVVCFSRERWYDRRVWTPLLLIAIGLVMAMIHSENETVRAFDSPIVPFVEQLSVFCLSLFACCMICHGELARLKPSAEHLTSFYLAISIGGALGGVLSAIVAPTLLSGLWEYHLALFATYCLLALCILRAATGLPRQVRGLGPAIAVAGACVLAAVLGNNVLDTQQLAIESSRNFYGCLTVREYSINPGDNARAWSRDLWHGKEWHGAQFTAPAYQGRPTAYYGETSGVGQSLKLLTEPGKPPIAVAAVGLGVGTVATYLRSEDSLRFYEINPAVLRIANEHFTFLRKSKGRVETVVGDARLSLERELATGEPQEFDLLILDAFNSDSVPVHLLTLEAFELYFARLKADGVIAIHTSTDNFDLSAVVRGAARQTGKRWLRVTNESDYEKWIESSEWILLTSNEAFLQRIRGSADRETGQHMSVVWTDDHSNLFRLLRW